MMSGQSLFFIKPPGRPRDYSDAADTLTHQAGTVSTASFICMLMTDFWAISRKLCM